MTVQDGITAGVEILINEARRLGLQWRIVPATVAAESGSPTNVSITFDGDEQTARAQSLIGNLPADHRVMILVIPPQGNYIIGVLTQNLTELFAPVNVPTTSIGADTTTGAGYGQLGGSSIEKAFTKYFENTRVRIDMSTTAYTTVASTTMRVGMQFIGGSNLGFDVINFFFNTANEHTPTSGHAVVSSLPVGSYTCRPIWLRAAGTGTLTTDANDWISYTVQETW